MLTELVFILDRSGSMAGLEEDTIGGYNALLKKQKAVEGKARITTVLFDDQYELLHYRADIDTVKPITGEEYYVRGCTALLDAVGRTVARIKSETDSLGGKEKPDKVMFVITTDGMENSSREYSQSTVKNMIEKRKKDGWEFLFLGANIDAVAAARSFGIDRDRAVKYKSDRQGTRLNYEVVSDAVSCIRENRPLSAGWKRRIERDMESRG